MNKFSLPNLKTLLLATSMGLSSPAFAQEISTVANQSEAILTGMCIPELSNLHERSEPLVIEAGDTFSAIASERGVNFTDFILFLREFNPGINIDKISIGDEFQVLARDITQEEINTYRAVLEKKQQFEEINRLWEAGEIEQLQEMTSFDITPRFPISLGLRNAYEVIASMTEQGYIIGPRTAFPSLQAGAVCNHVMKTFVKYILGIVPTPATQALYDSVRMQDQDAWIFPETLEELVGYIRVPESDLRALFNQRFASQRIAITGENTDAYEAGLLRQLAFLRTPEAVGSFIPTLYQHTATASTVFGTFAGREPNSHMFVNAAYSTTNDITEIQGVILEGNLGEKIEDILVSLVKEYGGISGYTYASSTAILEALTHIHEFVDIQILLDGVYVPLTFDDNLNITNGYESIELGDIEGFRIGGSILLDGYQITQNPTGGKRIIEQRLNFDWIVYMSHFLPNPIFHPTSILQVPPEMLDAIAEGTIGTYTSQIRIEKFIDVKLGEEVNDVYFEAIAQNMFENSYESISADQKLLVQERYQIHSLGLQLLGYHSFGGRAWNDGGTNPNAPIPFIRVDTPADIEHMQQLYAAYIQERRAEYVSLLQDVCDTNTFYPLPYMQLLVFPGDSKYSLMYYLGLQLRIARPELYDKFLSLSFIDKEAIILNTLGEDIFRGELASGSRFIVGYNAFEAAIDLQLAQSPEIPALLDVNGDTSPDSRIISAVAETPIEEYMLAWSLILESYVDNYDGNSAFDRAYIWNIFENHIQSRRAGKDYVHHLENMGFQDWFDAQDDTFWSMFPNWFIQELQDKGVIDSNRDMIRVSSLSDFQVRIAYNMNNYNTAYKETWPGKNLVSVIDVLLTPDGKYQELFSEYPEYENIIQNDLRVLQEVKEMFINDTQSQRGGEIEALIRSISYLDSGNQSNIVSKIFWAELLRSIDQDNSQKIFQHILNSGHSMSDVPQLGERFPLSMLLVRNMGPQKGLYLWTENYLQRLISHIDADLELPAIKTTEGLSNQTIYGSGVFISNMRQYREIISTLSIPENQRAILIGAIDGIDSTYTEEDIFTFFQNTELQNIFQEYGLDSFILPQVEEFQNSNLFRYTAQMDTVGARRVYKPSLQTQELVIPLGLLLLLQGASVIMVVNFVKRRTKKLVKDLKKGRVNASIRKLNRDKKSLEKMYGEVKNLNIDTYLQGYNNPQNLVLTNLHGITGTREYQDGHYKIGSNSQSQEILFRPFRNQKNLVLTNDPENSESLNYADGYYVFVNNITQIVRDAYMKTLSGNVDTTHGDISSITKKDILILETYQKIDMDIAAE